MTSNDSIPHPVDLSGGSPAPSMESGRASTFIPETENELDGTPPRKALDWIFSAVLGVCALAIYAATLPRGLYPGISAQLVIEHLGVTPRMTPAYPFWNLLMRTLGMGGAQNLAGRANLLSALFGAATVGLFHGILYDFLRQAFAFGAAPPDRARKAALFGSLLGAGCLATAEPFWQWSTRAHPATFELFLLLCVTRLVLYAADGENAGRMFPAAVLAGVAAVETPAMLLLFPIFGLHLALARSRFESPQKLRSALALGLFVFTAAGATLLAAMVFRAGEGFHLRGYGRLFNVIVELWTTHYRNARNAFPAVGWLLVLAGVFIPWLLCLSMAPRTLSGEVDRGLSLMHLVFTVVFALEILNIPVLRIWRFSASTPAIQLTIVAMLAWCFGYLGTFWSIGPWLWWSQQVRDPDPDTDEPDAPDRPAHPWLSRYAGLVFSLALAAIPAVSLWRHPRQLAPRAVQDIHTFCEQVLEDSGDRRWLITDGAFDTHLRLLAHERGRPLDLINLYANRNRVAFNLLRDRLPDARSRVMAEISLFTMLQDWIENRPDLAGDTAVLFAPDIWPHHLYRLQPSRTVLLPEPMERKSAETIEERFLRHQRFWATRKAPPAGTPGDPLLGFLARAIRIHYSRVANQLGVRLEDEGLPERAFNAYGAARSLYEENISATLNQYNLLSSGVSAPPEEVASIRAALEARKPSKMTVGQLWRAARVFGEIRKAHVFGAIAATTALHNRPGEGVGPMLRAIDLLEAGDPRRADYSRALAAFELKLNRRDPSRSRYLSLLAERPDDTVALRELARLELIDGRPEEALRLLDAVLAANASGPDIVIERATVLHLLERNEEARRELEALSTRHPDNPLVWYALARSALREGDDTAADSALANLHRYSATPLYENLINGQIALRDGRIDTAQACFEAAFQLQPDNPAVLAVLMRLAQDTGQWEKLQRYASARLRVDARDPAACRAMGLALLSQKLYAKALPFLEQACERAPDFASLNNLAWTLYKLDRQEEAEDYARRAQRLATGPNGSILHTLGAILLARDKLSEAESVLREAVRIDPAHAAAQSLLSETLARQKQTKP